ncbi:hypothetical protein ABIE65_000474 [Constrictibacter sp. MBR-5]|uniref:hypothetical protein n=1 Tax=Constrictibacter sp. MBR-5 TaxID=3156467 RepID=UPI0033958BFD
MTTPRRRFAEFFAARWRGAVPLRRVFWWDMLVVGSAINVAAAMAALLALSLGVPGAAAVALFLAPLPYNLFLTAAVWRTAPQDSSGMAARAVATVWCVVVTLV